MTTQMRAAVCYGAQQELQLIIDRIGKMIRARNTSWHIDDLIAYAEQRQKVLAELSRSLGVTIQ